MLPRQQNRISPDKHFLSMALKRSFVSKWVHWYRLFQCPTNLPVEVSRSSAKKSETVYYLGRFGDIVDVTNPRKAVFLAPWVVQLYNDLDFFFFFFGGRGC